MYSRVLAGLLLSVFSLVAWAPPASARAPERFTFDIAFDTVFTNCSDVIVGHFEVTETAIVTVDANGDVTAEMRHVLGGVVYRNERTGATLSGTIVRNHRRVLASIAHPLGNFTEYTLLSKGLISMVVVPSVGISHLAAGQGLTIFVVDDTTGELIGKVRSELAAGHDGDGFSLPGKICDALG